MWRLMNGAPRHSSLPPYSFLSHVMYIFFSPDLLFIVSVEKAFLLATSILLVVK